MIKKKPKISIIIRTKNEERWIEICLQKIYEQKEKNFEVIIVDNNSKDKTVIKAKKFPVKVIKIKNFLPGKAINLGIKKSNGKYIVCLSAHCIPENKDWLTKIIKGLNDKNVAGIYGRQKPLSYSSDFDKRDLLNLFGPEKKVQKKDNFFHNANSAFRKEFWKKNPFDEKTQHIEDRIWGHLVIQKGYKIIYEPEAGVYHWHGVNQDMEPERCKRIVNILESLGSEYVSKNLDNLKSLNCIGIVPLRGKSLQIDSDLSLLSITLKQLKKSKNIRDIFVATDNIQTKKMAIRQGAKVPFLRPKNLSDNYIDIKTTVSYFVDKLEKRGLSPDIIIIATENYPLRNPKIFDKMINLLVTNNFDVVVSGNKERGTLFNKTNKNIKMINDGEIPNKLRTKTSYVSRIGLACAARVSKLRTGSLFSGRLGICEIDSDIEMTEISSRTLSKALKSIIKIQNQSLD